MSDSHEKLPMIFWAQLALAAAIGVVFLITLSKSSSEHGASVEGKVESAAQNLAPVGAVSTSDASDSASASKGRSGEEVYKASCLACHATGVANAPKLDDKDAWEPRVANGLDALIDTAIKGKGAMPARGGNPAITDEEIKATVLYMLKQAGYDLKAEATSDKKEAVAATSSEPANTPEETPKETQTEIVAPTVSESPVAPTSPAAPVAPMTTEAPIQAKAEEVLAIAATSVQNNPSANNINKEGEKTYKSACFSCHENGIAGSPKLGDKAAWASRIAAGNEILYTAAIKGKGIMPPKGGNMGLSDDAVKAAVDFMVAKSQ